MTAVSRRAAVYSKRRAERTAECAWYPPAGRNESMLTRDENELLTRTGPGTAMGALLRCYWIPVVQSGEVEAGGRQARAPARRATHRLPRQERTRGAHRRVLPASGRLALHRARGGGGHVLRLSRLEVRRRRPLSRHAQRAARVELRLQGAPRRLSVRGARRRHLRLHGPRHATAALAARVDAPAGVAHPDLQASPGVQLVPGP